ELEGGSKGEIDDAVLDVAVGDDAGRRIRGKGRLAKSIGDVGLQRRGDRREEAGAAPVAVEEIADADVVEKDDPLGVSDRDIHRHEALNEEIARGQDEAEEGFRVEEVGLTGVQTEGGGSGGAKKQTAGDDLLAAAIFPQQRLDDHVDVAEIGGVEARVA